MEGINTMKLEVKNIKKSFNEKEVLHGISFEVDSGKALGLLGRNGAGKTTTIRILMDVFKANTGEILLDGKPFVRKNIQIGYLPEERGLYPKKTVIEQMMYLGELRGLSSKESKTNSDQWLKRLGIEEYRKSKLETLSKGNQQKVQLAQTLVANPDIVILDEPFSGLDPVNSKILKDVILELIQEGKLVIFSSHQMSYVEEFCQDIIIIDKGNVILSGNLKQVKHQFGENRIFISANNYSLVELCEMIKQNLNGQIKHAEVFKDIVLLELQVGCVRNDIVSKLIQQGIDIEKFGVYEPSLTDIFVKEVGGEE